MTEQPAFTDRIAIAFAGSSIDLALPLEASTYYPVMGGTYQAPKAIVCLGRSRGELLQIEAALRFDIGTVGGDLAPSVMDTAAALEMARDQATFEIRYGDTQAEGYIDPALSDPNRQDAASWPA